MAANTGSNETKTNNNPRNNEAFAEGDTFIIRNVLPDDLAVIAFDSLKKEVKWNVMHHRGGDVPRLVAVEGLVGEDGSQPVYRHPADESPPLLPFSPTVQVIKESVEKALGHPLNHVLIQLYRHGGDYISEHSDKTIDVVRDSKIVNVSLGAQRTMTLRTKRDAAKGTNSDRETQRIPLPHNSCFVMGLKTNEKWLHSIRHDRRPIETKSPEEQAFNGERISLTFRHIGTFLNKDETLIWGQGATSKSKAAAAEVINGGEDAQKLIDAFGLENQSSEFDWDAIYGEGCNVLHFSPHQSNASNGNDS